ncbi:isoprenylcysteine carboxylmethyltransferase family protein [Bacillus licheniformis]|nr:isoprenylcysteine carboxylmethyltransferase family protein [Bacillus licheniformis]
MGNDRFSTRNPSDGACRIDRPHLHAGSPVLGALFTGEMLEHEILVIPGTNLVRKGPYQWIKHPNYLAVALEFLLCPCFSGIRHRTLFTVLNAAVMYIRIRTEEQALENYTIEMIIISFIMMINILIIGW